MSDTCASTMHMFAERRRLLSHYVPGCPMCGESRTHMQLLNWFRSPAVWQCRQCHYSFEHEPIMPAN